MQVVSERDDLPEAALGELVVAVEVEEQGVLVADQIVTLEMVVVQLGLSDPLKTQLLLASSNWLIVSLALLLVEQK